jgi:hypothetical protein
MMPEFCADRIANDAAKLSEEMAAHHEAKSHD